MGKSRKNSSKLAWYKQCTFTSPSEEGETVQTAWIPEQFAVVGKKIYLGKKTDKPECIWTVITAASHRVSGDYLTEHERDYLTQREASDI